MAATNSSLHVGGPLGDTQRDVTRTNIQNTVCRWCLVNIGATGAPTIAPTGTVFGISRSGTGTYALTFPAHLSANNAFLRVTVALSAATTVAQATVTAFSQTAGTATFVTALNAAGTAVDPANGDILAVQLWSDDQNS